MMKDLVAAVLTVVAGGGVVVASLGFLINTIPWMLLRALASGCRGLPHEAFLSPDVLDRIRTILGYTGGPMRNEALFLSATFDHSTPWTRAFMHGSCAVERVQSERLSDRRPLASLSSWAQGSAFRSGGNGG